MDSGLSIADPSPSQSDQGNLGDASPLSPELRDKLNELAKWRIDPSLIEFPEDASEFEGGHATVSRALLTPASAVETDLNKNVEGGLGPRDGPIKKKVVAVKKLKTENAYNSERVLELALREAGLLVGLSSPYIIKLDGFVEDVANDRIWLIFPWEEHGNLKDFVASEDWEIPERVSLIRDVTIGVNHLHSQIPPIYHGDLKSINVLVTSKCRAVITDFGSARRLTANYVNPQMTRTEKEKAKPVFEATFCSASNTMTFTGTEYTFRWAAPELLMDDEPSLSSDIWALGWIFYEVMTDSIPFENVKKDSIIIKHIFDRKLSSVTGHLRTSLIMQLCSLMVSCWSVDPTERPTAEDCRGLLDWMPSVVPLPQQGKKAAISQVKRLTAEDCGSSLNWMLDLSGPPIPDSSPSQSDEANLSDERLLSPRLQNKLSKFKKWRIDPSLIEFTGGVSEFEGGHATISRALLSPASAVGAKLNEPENSQGGSNSRSGTVKSKAVAVKKLKTESKDTVERVLELALREAGFLVRLSFPHIIKLEGFVSDLPKSRIWLIFPWEELGNLKDFAASRDWSIPERISLIWDVASGVEYLHSRSPPICHGDLKSINILVNSEHRAVITDFGSARPLTKADVDPETTGAEKQIQPAPEFRATFFTTSNTMTFTGNGFTLRWAAPELLMDNKCSLKSDIWALGWIFFEVMTNSIPFEDVSKNSLVIKHIIDGKLPSVTQHIRMSLNEGLGSLMADCWNGDPTMRPAAKDCRKLLTLMRMDIPGQRQSLDPASSRSKNPDLLVNLGKIYEVRNDCINASKLYTEALNIYTEDFNISGMVSALHALGRLHMMQSEYGKAATLYSRAQEISTDIGDKRGRSLSMRGLAEAHSAQKEYSKAIKLYSEVIQISIDLDDQHQRASALRGLAQAHRLQEDYDQAVTFSLEAVESYTNVGSKHGRATALWGLAEAYRLQENYAQAVAVFSESLQICTDTGDKFRSANAILSLGDIHRDQDQHGEAIPLYEQAARIFEQIGDTRGVAAASRRATRSRRRREAAGTD